MGSLGSLQSFTVIQTIVTLPWKLGLSDTYKSLVEPHFRYCCPVWGNVGETSLTNLQKLQNRATRIFTGSRYDQSALPLIRALGWPTVREILDLEKLKMVFKSLNGDTPSYMRAMFTRVSETTSRILRNSDIHPPINLRTPVLRTSTGQRCFSFRRDQSLEWVAK